MSSSLLKLLNAANFSWNRTETLFLHRSIRIDLIASKVKQKQWENERNGFPLEENFIKHAERIGNDTKSAFLALQRLPIYVKFLS